MYRIYEFTNTWEYIDTVVDLDSILNKISNNAYIIIIKNDNNTDEVYYAGYKEDIKGNNYEKRKRHN